MELKCPMKSHHRSVEIPDGAQTENMTGESGPVNVCGSD